MLLAVAKGNHDLENYFAVKKVYAELKVQGIPTSPCEFAYLDLKGQEETRAAECRRSKRSGRMGTVTKKRSVRFLTLVAALLSIVLALWGCWRYLFLPPSRRRS